MDLACCRGLGASRFGHRIGVRDAVALAEEVDARRLVRSHINFHMSPTLLSDATAKHPWVTVAHDGMHVHV